MFLTTTYNCNYPVYPGGSANARSTLKHFCFTVQINTAGGDAPHVAGPVLLFGGVCFVFFCIPMDNCPNIDLKCFQQGSSGVGYQDKKKIQLSKSSVIYVRFWWIKKEKERACFYTPRLHWKEIHHSRGRYTNFSISRGLNRPECSAVTRRVVFFQQSAVVVADVTQRSQTSWRPNPPEETPRKVENLLSEAAADEAGWGKVGEPKKYITAINHELTSARWKYSLSILSWPTRQIWLTFQLSTSSVAETQKKKKDQSRACGGHRPSTANHISVATVFPAVSTNKCSTSWWKKQIRWSWSPQSKVFPILNYCCLKVKE